MRNEKKWKDQFAERLVNFAVRIILLANMLPKTPAGFAIANQLIKAATSIGANFIEAQDASSSKDFIQKLSISLREARETWYWLTVIKKAGLLNGDMLDSEIIESEEIIAVFVKSIKSSKSKLV